MLLQLCTSLLHPCHIFKQKQLYSEHMMTLMSFIKEHLEESLIQASRLVDQSLRLVCKHLPTTYLSSNEPAKKVLQSGNLHWSQLK